MKSPKDQRTIQIDITNACPHKCSNCTRFCGHHKKNFFMDFVTFQRAVDSLEGFQGTIGMMGGEPTIHPEFERFARYLEAKTPAEYKEKENQFVKPQKDFMRSMHNREFESVTILPTDCKPGTKVTNLGPGLWSTMGNKYKEHYELIQDIFKMQSLNDHGNIMYHSPILVSRKELQIPDDEWIKLRDECWIQNCWSSTITPKGAFFCEVAGALDMLFDGPGGWPIEKGWWKRTPEEFGEQLQWCEICGMALDLFTRDANEEVDDVSPEIYEKLMSIGSPKAKNGKVNVLKIENGIIAEESKESIWGIHKNKYWESYESRMSTDTVLYPKGFEGLIWYDEASNLEQNVNSISENLKQLNRAVLFGENQELLEKAAELIHDERLSVTWLGDTEYEDSFGRMLNRVFDRLDESKEWLALSGNIEFDDCFTEQMSKMILNLGTMHYQSLSKKVLPQNPYIRNYAEQSHGFAAMFSKKALALKKTGYDGISQIKNFEEFIALWDLSKIVPLSEEMDYDCPDNVIEEGKKYILYGTGKKGRRTAETVRQKKAFIYAYCDSNSDKWGMEYDGSTILSPDEIVKNRDFYYKVIIASNFYQEIRSKLHELGLTDRDLVLVE